MFWLLIINIIKYVYFSQLIGFSLRSLLFNFRHEGFICWLNSSSACLSELFLFDNISYEFSHINYLYKIVLLFILLFKNRRKILKYV